MVSLITGLMKKGLSFTDACKAANITLDAGNKLINDQKVTKRYLIATGKVPSNEQFIELLKEFFADACCELVAAKGIWSVKYCYNLAVKVTGNEEVMEYLIQVLTMTMMPARWTICADDFDGFEILIPED